MRVIKIYLFSFFLFMGQMHSQTSNDLKEINAVWSKFYQAFETLDYSLMAEIHSKALVRISGGQRISDYDTYINRYKTQFVKAKENGITNNISLRFFERINNDSIASERGIYQLIRNKDQDSEQTYYGQFHVLFKKENGEWKILMDYDSTEDNTIGEDDFNKAHAITDFESFIKQ